MNNISNRPTLQEFIDIPIDSWTREKLIKICEEFRIHINRTSTSSTKRQLMSKIMNYLIEQDSINRHSQEANTQQNTEANTEPSENNFPELNRMTLPRFRSTPSNAWTREQLIRIADEGDIDTQGTTRQLYNRILQNLQQEFNENNGDYNNRRQLESESEPELELDLDLDNLSEISESRWDENEFENNSESESTNVEAISEAISEEDTNDISSITSSENDIKEIKQFTSNQCKNEDLIMGEPYTVDTNDDVFIMYIQKPNSNNFNDTGICVSKTEIKEYLKSDLTEDNPKVLMTLWTGKNLDNSGHYGKPSGRIIVKMPPFNTFVTLGSLEQMIKNDYNKEWFLYPLYNGKRRRIGNLQGSYGSSQNHGQIPGSIIYKAYNKKQILKGIQIKEEYSDFPLFIYDNFRSLQQILNDPSIKQLSHGLIQSLLN